jgi:hypothetical protein
LVAATFGGALAIACAGRGGSTRTISVTGAQSSQQPSDASNRVGTLAQSPRASLDATAKPLPTFEPPLEHEALPNDPTSSTPAQSLSARSASGTATILSRVPGLPAAAARCTRRFQMAARLSDRSCDDSSQAWTALADALALSDVEGRDRKLWETEACRFFAPGLIRALRAELDPSCGDVIVESLLRDNRQLLSSEWLAALQGLALAAQLHRAITPLSPMRAPPGSLEAHLLRAITPMALMLDPKVAAHIDRYMTGVLIPWRDAQMGRLDALGAKIEGLPEDSYGRVVATMASAWAWHQLISGARATPIPDLVKRDYPLRTRYYGTVDDDLDVVRQRSKQWDIQAAHMASRQGIRRTPIANEWYGAAITSTLPDFASTLGKLKIPMPPTYPVENVRQYAAYRLPTFYAGALFSGDDVNDPRIVRGLIENGLAIAHRRLWTQAKPSAEVAELLAYGRFALARRTLERVHVDVAIDLLRQAPEKVKESADLQLLLATATAVRTGPRSLEEPGQLSVHITHWEALRDLARDTTVPKIKAFALVNQALLRLLDADEAMQGQILPMLGEAVAVNAGRDVADCLREFVQDLKFRGKPERVCTLADPP